MAQQLTVSAENPILVPRAHIIFFLNLPTSHILIIPVLGKQTYGFLVYHHSTLGEVQVSEQLFQKTRWVASCSLMSTYTCTNVHQHTCAHTYTHLEAGKVLVNYPYVRS